MSESSDRVKVSFNLPVQEVETLRAIAKARGVTMTEVVRQAILKEMFFHERAAGSKVLLEDDEGATCQVVFPT